jgi:competence protein ComEC
LRRFEWSSLLETLRAWVRAEAGAGRLLPWVPIAFGAGIAFYFGADHEPVAWVTAVTAIAFCAAAFLLRRQKIFPIAVLIAAMAAGFAVATWKTVRVAHGVLARPMYSVQLSGFVETRDIRERTDRFVLRVAQMESPRGQIKLERVRLSVRKGTAPAVGSFVELKARLQPPLAPLQPAATISAAACSPASAPPVLSPAPSRPWSRRSLAVCHCAMPPSCRVCGMQSTREYATSWMATSAPSPPRS